MGDYLTDLVTKNTGMAEVIRPRRPSRFEPARPLSAFDFEDGPSPGDRNGLDDSPHVEPPPDSRRRRQSNERDNATSSRKALSGPPFTPPPDAHSSKIVTGTSFLAAADEMLEANRAARRNPAASSLLSPIRSAPVEPSPLSVQPAERQRKPTGLIERAPLGETASKPGESKTAPAGVIEKQSVEPRSAIVVVPRVEKSGDRARTNRRDAVSGGSAAKQFAGNAPTPPAPVINVTIGRIEVRAAVAPPAPSKERPATAKMLSLDEYLRRRNNGGER